MKKEKKNLEEVYKRKYKKYHAASKTSLATAITFLGISVATAGGGLAYEIPTYNRLENQFYDNINTITQEEDFNADDLIYNDSMAAAFAGLPSLSKEEINNLLRNETIRDEIYKSAKSKVENGFVTREEFERLLDNNDVSEYIYEYARTQKNPELQATLNEKNNIDTLDNALGIVVISELLSSAIGVVVFGALGNIGCKYNRKFRTLKQGNEELDDSCKEDEPQK